MNPETRNWLTLPEVAERIGASPKTVRRLVRLGRLPALKHGKTLPLRFRQVDVDRYVDAELDKARAAVALEAALAREARP